MTDGLTSADPLPRDPTEWESCLLGVVTSEPIARVDLDRVLATVDPGDWSTPDRADLWRWARRLVARDGIVCCRTLIEAATARRRQDLVTLVADHWGQPPAGCSVLLVDRYAAEVVRASVLRRLRALRQLEEWALDGQEVSDGDVRLGPREDPVRVIEMLAGLRAEAVARLRGLDLVVDLGADAPPPRET